MGKFLALDFGTKRIGVASGEAGIAFPREVFENKGLSANVEKISELVFELGVGTIVVGLPLNMEAGMPENRQMAELEAFVDELRLRLRDIDVVFFDERLSSFEASGLMSDLRDRGIDNALGKDAFEAQIILQRFFDNMRS